MDYDGFASRKDQTEIKRTNKALAKAKAKAKAKARPKASVKKKKSSVGRGRSRGRAILKNRKTRSLASMEDVVEDDQTGGASSSSDPYPVVEPVPEDKQTKRGKKEKDYGAVCKRSKRKATEATDPSPDAGDDEYAGQTWIFDDDVWWWFDWEANDWVQAMDTSVTEADESWEVEVSFARRAPPTTAVPYRRWDAIRQAFMKHIAQGVLYPSKYQDRFL